MTNSTLNYDNFYIANNKGLLIDIAAFTILQDLNGLKNAPIDVMKYHIRSAVRSVTEETLKGLAIETLKEYIPNIGAIAGGAASGTFKYALTNQNIPAGIINNAAYALCNNYDWCNTAKGTFIASIALETVDPLVQELFNNFWEASLLLDGSETITEMAQNYGYFAYEAIKGADYAAGLQIGLIMAVSAEIIYSPNDKYVPNLVKCASSETAAWCAFEETGNAILNSLDHLGAICTQVIGFSSGDHSEL